MFAIQKEIKRNKKNEMAKQLKIAVIANFGSDGFVWQQFMLGCADIFAVYQVQLIRVLPDQDKAMFHLDFENKVLEPGITYSLYDLALPISLEPIAAGCYFAHKQLKADVVLIEQDMAMMETVLKQLRTKIA